MDSICQALNLSDNAKCDAKVGSYSDVFCPLHARQAQGLYLGYKKRTAKLHTLASNEPDFLAQSTVSLSTQSFAELDHEDDLRVVCNYLHKRHRLLSEVAQARRWHHDHFFPLNLDYGHERFIEKLQFERLTVLRALERAEARLSEIMFSKQRWYQWSRKVQAEDDLAQEKEKKKIAMENAMFQRQLKQMQSKMKARRAKEDKKRQEAFLEQAYQERLQEDEEGQLDPIDDEMYNMRDDYIELIRHFLWMEAPINDENDVSQENETGGVAGAEEHGEAETAKAKARKKKKKPARAANTNGESTVQGQNERVPDKTRIEQQDEMRKRLKSGAKFNNDGVGPIMVGTFENPQFTKRTPGLESDMIDGLMKEVAEIKQLLFCRILLTQVSLVPVALNAESVEDFLTKTDVSDTDLRDLCLKLEQPGLQAIPDACADLYRTDTDERDAEDDKDEMALAKKPARLHRLWDPKVPKTWKPKRERSSNALGREESGTLVNFGAMDVDPVYSKKMTTITLCGKTIWNQASQASMSRSGWLQFSIIAKDESLLSAIRLCRSWDEFFELNALAILHYFPASNWQSWIGDLLNNQLLKSGIFMYFSNTLAESLTVTRNTHQRHAPRTHHVQEFRSIMCAHMKRNDPAVRRFIQYVVMASSKMHILVRDGKTGEFITEPDKDDIWLLRCKSGIGRAAKNEWDVIRSVNEQFFEEMDDVRQWHFSLDDFYDVYIWDHEPGNPFAYLYENMQRLWFKARRITEPRKVYSPVESIYRTLTRDKYMRPRDIRPGEDVETLWDELQKTKMIFGNINFKTGEGFSDHFNEESITNMSGGELPDGFGYTEADELEDAILFPETKSDDPDFTLTEWERSGPSVPRFLLKLDSDEESIDPLEQLVESKDGTSAPRLNGEADPDPDNSDLEDEDDDESESDTELARFHTNATPEEVWSLEGSKSNKKRNSWDVGLDKLLACLLVYAQEPKRAPTFLKQDPSYTWLKQWNKRSMKCAWEHVTNPDHKHADFMEYVLRDKSHVFKKAFHVDELEPGYTGKRDETTKFLRAIEKNVMEI